MSGLVPFSQKLVPLDEILYRRAAKDISLNAHASKDSIRLRDLSGNIFVAFLKTLEMSMFMHKAEPESKRQRESS